MNAVAPETPSPESAIAACEAGIDACLLRDQPRLRKRLAGLRRRLRHAADRAGVARVLAEIEAARERSAAVCIARAAWRPRLSWPADLPFTDHVQTIGALLDSHQVLILSGETGSGKSTQLPKLCLALGRGVAGRIGHTQPRRIAARAIARRIAEETVTAPGALVGHSIRFDDNVAPAARIKVMTDGILLNEIHEDPSLLQYDTLIIDEVHERSLNVEFILGYLKRVLVRRPDLKLIVTSATLDVEMFATFFTGAARHVIPGRAHAVELRHRPLLRGEAGEEEVADINDALLEAVRELDADDYGDILVFLPGEREIREAFTYLGRAGLAQTEVLTLFARMSAARQARVFEPGPLRRIILATNVAETSLTVPRVRHVIDTGVARVSRYSPRRKLQQLPVEKIARANAEQRAGRCGRERPGICIRLYSEADFLQRRASQEPEILRTNLAGVILRLKSLGIDDVEGFPFVEPPATRLIKDGYGVLQEIGALDAERRLTACGTRLVRYPTDPRLARVLLAAGELGCLAECCIIVAALSIVDPRERPHEMREAADRAHAAFEDRRSDFLWFLRAFAHAREVLGWSAKRQWRHCRRQFLSAVRLREWVQLHDYLVELTRAEGLTQNTAPASYKAIHTALAAGFPSHIGEWQGEHYLGCRNATFSAHPSSVLARHAPRWVIAAEMLETNRRYARIVARFEPSWLERVAGHLIRRSYDAPCWDVRRGCARVTEIQRLHGLVINGARQVDYARVDAPAARALFIDAALVDGELGEEVAFLRHNQALVARIRELEARARRRDLLQPREALHAFYADRLPPEVLTRRELLAWLRTDPGAAAALCMRESDVSSEAHGTVQTWLFPDSLNVGGSPCRLRYRYEPGAEDDGVTISVPLLLVPRLAAAGLDRLVPGLLSTKVEALLRALPKRQRRLLAPAREYAMAMVEALGGVAGPLPVALACIAERLTGSPWAAALFDESALPAHLRCRIEVLDETGQLCASGRALTDIEQHCGEAARAARAALSWTLSGRSSSGWTLPALPLQVEVVCAGVPVPGYPALCDRGSAVEIAIFDTADEATSAHLDGVARLLALGAGRELRHVEAALGDAREFALLAARYGHAVSPCTALVLAAARRRVAASSTPRDADAYSALAQAFAVAVAAEVVAAARQIHTLFRRGARVLADIERLAVPAASASDLRSQVQQLLGPGLIALVDAGHGARIARSLDAIERRLQRVDANPGKDLKKLERLAPLWSRFLADAARDAPGEARRRELHWMFEDFRIALFAPELGAAARIDLGDLEQALDALARPA